MMIVVTPQDFSKLSKACQLELISMMGYAEVNNGFSGEAISGFSSDEEIIADLYMQNPRHPTANDIVGDKQVIDITNEHAQSLIANISDKSLQTLKLFAQGEPIELNELVGADKLYENFNDLKRSFVGAVNRRLRTVTGNRQAVLFSTARSKAGEEATRIRVKPRTAAALRMILNIREPLPEFEFYSSDGHLILKADPATKPMQDILHEKLSSAWQSFSGHPNHLLACVTPIQIAEHYVSHGFAVKIGSAVGWDEENNEPEYAFSEPIFSIEVLTAKLSNLQSSIGAEEHNTQIALMHPELSDLLVMPIR